MVAAPNPLRISASEYDPAYKAAAEVLRDHGFAMDRQDYRFGLIETGALMSPTIGEPFRPGNTTVEQALESTLNHQRRIARVMLEPLASADDVSAPPQGYNLHVEVMIERRQQPDLQMSGATSGYGVYHRYTRTPSELQDRGINGAYWQPLRRDLYMEQRLMSDILDRIGSGSAYD